MRPYFVILSTRRSGKNLFLGLLESAQKIPLVLKYNSESFNDNHHIADGFSVELENLNDLISFLGSNNIFHADLKWIWIRRRNKIRQGMSYYIAEKSGLWQKTERLPVSQSAMDNADKIQHETIPIKDLNESVLLQYMSEDSCRNFFDSHGITPYEVWYEHASDRSNWEKIISEVLNFLEAQFDSLPALEPTHQKQADNSTKHLSLIHI